MKPSSNNGRIRNVVICNFINQDKILVSEAYDSVKKQTYYRPLGGGIEFQESAISALKREINEELGTEISDERYLGMLENIFVMEGRPKHEILMVYTAVLSDGSFYDRESIEIKEAGWLRTIWKSLDEFTSGKLILYPEGILDLIKKT